MVRTLLMMIVITTVLIAVGATAILVPDQKLAILLQSLRYVVSEWLFIVMLKFLELYTDDDWSNAIVQNIIYAIAVFTSGFLLLNTRYGHIVICNRVTTLSGVEANRFYIASSWFWLPQIFLYFLVFCNLTVLVRQSIHATNFYRQKYAIVAAALCGVTIFDALCEVNEHIYDYSLYSYGLLMIFLTYFSIYYIPQGLITQTLSYVAASSSNGVVCFDLDDKCIYANDVARQIYGNPEKITAFEKIFKKETDGERFLDFDRRRWDRELDIDKSTKYLDISFSHMHDSNGTYTGCYFTIYDKTAEIEFAQRERYRFTHDMLTHLYNREYFYECVQKKREEEPDEAYCMVCTDIRDFKLINDLYGFDTGDCILVRLASVLLEFLPENTICGRLVGDHFAFFIPKKQLKEEMFAGKISTEIKSLASSEYSIRVHIGIYEVQPEDQDVAVMCDHANMAIGTIKNEYDCMIAYYDDTLTRKAVNDNRIVSEFDTALEDGQFEMFLQAQVAANGVLTGAEALVRWRHPERGLISPSEFIPVFEETGLIYRLDQCIWECAAKQLKIWHDMGHDDLKISVNISARDFYYLDIYKCFTELVQRYGVEPGMLNIEITETAIMMNLDKQLDLLEKLQKYGFHVEIDDFGSGYSSLNMLKNMHADVLKIDMGFLRETQNHKRTKIILNTIIDLAKQLHMTVITEGVETERQVRFLTGAGCDIFQGFYFSRPISVEDFEKKYFLEKKEKKAAVTG
jgi:diguanylate cyclase (GGDEF)-like protein